LRSPAGSAQSATPPRFEYFTPELAAEVDAIAARIIPTDETLGAREAGVVYFIDRALTTFASDDRKLYAEGIAELQARTHEMFPGVERFSVATAEQQDEILRSLDKNATSHDRPFRTRALRKPNSQEGLCSKRTCRPGIDTTSRHLTIC
jgi:hypothetical protein